MSSLPGILFFIIGVLAAVAIHEFGHLIPAKKFGVKVSRYFIGFGPTLWSTHKRGTEWGVKALPLGGFVSIAGMLPPAKPGTRTHEADGDLTLAEEARRESAKELEPGEEHSAFYNLSAPKKLAVMFGGPGTNLILSFLLLATVMLGVGMPVLTNSVSAVSACVTGEEACDAIDAAPASGILEPGDEIIQWGSTPTNDWSDVQRAIANSATGPVDVTIVRDGVEQTVTITPVLQERPNIDANGEVMTDAAGQPETEMRPFVGISAGIDRERASVADVPRQTWDLAKGTAGIIVALPVHLWNTASDLVTGQPRDRNSIVGLVGVADMAGSISSSETTGYGVMDRAADLLMILAALNMSLFMFNMLPLLPLDGGHILGAIIEGSRRTLARFQGKPDPGPFDTARLLPLSYGVVVFFIAMTILLVVADIFNPVF